MRRDSALAAAGATVLRWDDDPKRLRALARQWLEDALAPAFGRPPWPAALAWLEALVTAKGAKGLTLDDLAQPATGVLALVEAEARGLLVEVAPGRYVSS